MKVRCGNCGHWLGEAPAALVYVKHVAKEEDPNVAPPRDVRYCKSCNRVSVFVVKTELEARLAS